jgi:hypothetical protein
MPTITQRNEWQFFSILPKVDAKLAFAWWVVLILRGISLRYSRSSWACSSHTVFTTASAERLGLLTTPSAARASGVASDHATATTTVAELRLGAACLRELAARTFDLGHVNRALEARGAPAIDGAIGGDVLRPAEAVIDYARATLYLRGSAVAP